MIERSNRHRELTKYQELIELRDKERERIASSSVCVNGRALPLEVNPQGMLKWYMHPAIDSTAHKFLIFYTQEIPPASRSGKQRSQGGVVFVVVEGAGYTVIDGGSNLPYRLPSAALKSPFPKLLTKISLFFRSSAIPCGSARSVSLPRIIRTGRSAPVACLR